MAGHLTGSFRFQSFFENQTPTRIAEYESGMERPWRINLQLGLSGKEPA